jgi:high-affinity Fe2+/Pb2+ permease
MFNVFMYIGIIVLILGIILIEFVVVGILFIKFFPKSKITSWIRKYVVSDVDLEPLKGNESQSTSETLNS